MRRYFVLQYVLIVCSIFLASYIYEFWIEGGFSFFMTEDEAHFHETSGEHWEYIITVTIFSAVALLLPTIMMYRIDSRLRKIEADKLALQIQLDETLTKLLSGFLGICSVCKKVRVKAKDTKSESWSSIDAYIAEHTDLKFSHGYCPDCYAKVVQELEKKK